VILGVASEPTTATEESPVPHPFAGTASAHAAVIVLGMHRSGTSSVAGAFVRLGGKPPCHLMAAAPDNARGFWESTVLASLNDEILAAGGSAWKDWRRFDIDRIDAAVAEALRERAEAALVAEFGSAGVPVVKDPRMCRLMSFWRPVFLELAWSPRVVLPVRSPLEVAWSLRRRDGVGVGAGCLLWLRHVLDAEADTRGMTRAVLDWSQLLDDCPASLGPVVEQLDMDWARRDSQAFAEVEDFLSADLRCFSASAADLNADPDVAVLVRDVYAAMLDLTDDADNAATLLRLEALRSRFEDAVAIFDPIIRETERAMEAQVRATRAAQESLGAAQNAARTTAERIDQLERRIGALEAQNSAQARDLAARLADADARARQQDEALARANAVIARYAVGTAVKTDARRLPRLPSRPHGGVSRQELWVVRNSPFFDQAFYLGANPDVRAAGGDAALHYCLHGWCEGRDPGPFFSTTNYLARNPDVRAAGMNPLVHYERHGRKEDRAAIGCLSAGASPEVGQGRGV
jgi:hypothetical protein